MESVPPINRIPELPLIMLVMIIIIIMKLISDYEEDVHNDHLTSSMIYPLVTNIAMESHHL